MKTTPPRILRRKLLLFFLLLATLGRAQQGRVVINEYMPWPSNTCGTTSEFIELLNFGPGAMDIGCYTVTNGTYSVTIPPNTILLPGQFYVIAGQDYLPVGCANVDSAVQAALNWNTCNCTNLPIPTTGEGFMQDGGGGNVNLVLLDPNKKVVDAVTRALPTSPALPITTSGVGGACTQQSFLLDTMNINYETLGMSTGNANSFARKLDGDCGWIKTPKQSANATNNKTGNVSAVSYDFSIVNSMDCSGASGRVNITVKSSSYSNVFPMTYTIAKDVDDDGVFSLTDSYTDGLAINPPNILIGGLSTGRYRVTVASVQGCFLQSFDFYILPCSVVLPVTLQYFRLRATGRRLEWAVGNSEALKEIVLEKSRDGRQFAEDRKLLPGPAAGLQAFSVPEPPGGPYFRLRLLQKDGAVSYSPVLNTLAEPQLQLYRFGPNPAAERLLLTLESPRQVPAEYAVYDQLGSRLLTGRLLLKEGLGETSVPVSALRPGIYGFVLAVPGHQPISFRFVKD